MPRLTCGTTGSHAEYNELTEIVNGANTSRKATKRGDNMAIELTQITDPSSTFSLRKTSCRHSGDVTILEVTEIHVEVLQQRAAGSSVRRVRSDPRV